MTSRTLRVARPAPGVAQDLQLGRAGGRGRVGNSCLGRVARVLPGMQSAFVDIGLERAAFLHIADIWEHRPNGHGQHRPIERILHEGQSLLVQVRNLFDRRVYTGGYPGSAVGSSDPDALEPYYYTLAPRNVTVSARIVF